MDIHSFTVGPFSENTYLLLKDTSALLIDPGFYEEHEFGAVKDTLDQKSASLSAVILTHAHVDHVLGLHRLLEEFDVPVYLSDKDRYLWNNFSSQAGMFGFRVDPFDFDPEPIPIQNGWIIDSFEFEVRYTPGHAPDHIVLYSGDSGVLIAGDTLFRQGIGRTDLYKGDFELLESSIKEQLYTLPEDTEVFPGHGPKTSIGYEKQNNPFVRG